MEGRGQWCGCINQSLTCVTDVFPLDSGISSYEHNPWQDLTPLRLASPPELPVAGNLVTSTPLPAPQVAALVAVVSCDRGYSGGGGRFSGATLVNDQRSQNAYGEYNFQYETSDGTFRHEEGSQNNGQVSRGRYS